MNNLFTEIAMIKSMNIRYAFENRNAHCGQVAYGGNTYKSRKAITLLPRLGVLMTFVIVLTALFSSAPILAQQSTSTPSTSINAQSNDSKLTINEQLQNLRKEVIALNRDLFVLEEDLLFPSSTQVVVYLAMDVGTYFELDSVQLNIDDKTVSHYLYTDKQIKALYKGGVQKLHLENLAQGEHELTAFFIGKGPQGREYKRATSLVFNKTAEAASIELSIVDSSVKQQPIFKAVEL